MLMSEQLKEMTVDRRARGRRSPQVAREEGMLTLREDGLVKARAGITSIEEIARVTVVKLRGSSFGPISDDDLGRDGVRFRRGPHADGRASARPTST